MEKFSSRSPESDIPRELTVPERQSLRNTLKALGIVLATITPSKTNDYEQVSTLPSNIEVVMQDDGREVDVSSIQSPEVIGDLEQMHQRYTAAEQLRVQLRADQVMATTSRGELLAGPIDLEPRLGWEVEDMIMPTERNGGHIQGIPGRYLEELRDAVREEYGLLSDTPVRIEHVYQSLSAAHDGVSTIAEFAETRLQDVPIGERETYANMIERHFHPVFGSTAEAQFMTDSLKHVLPALITKESMFSPTAVSRAGARAELQILPATFSQYAGSDANPQDFQAQLEVASRYFESSYRYLTANLRNQLDVIRYTYFDDNETAFTQHFLFPLLVNAYNAGDGNMERVVDWFINNFHDPSQVVEALGFNSQKIAPEDVYLSMVTLAREQEAVPAFREQASRYALDIIATSGVINAGMVPPIRLAAN